MPGPKFPMKGKCQINNVVYKNKVTSSLQKKINFGIIKSEWKKGYYNHKNH